MKRYSAYAALFGIAAILLVVRTPATASVTASALTAATPSYTGTCPTTEKFTGTISGTPGQAFQYSFNRFINGAQQVQNVGAATIPSGGTLNVSDSFSIPSSSVGANFDQVWVHNIAGGQGDVYSNKANFTVTCGGATPNPYAVLHPGVVTLARPVVTLNSLEWTWRRYTYEYVGFMSTYVPEFGTGPCTDLCVGWLHIKQGDSAWLYHHNSFLRGWIAFSNAVKTAHATKATLTLPIASGDPSCLGGIGMAKGAWAGVSQHDFKTGVPTDGDFSLPTSFAVNGGTVTFDVTSIVQAWETGHSNDGFVIRGKTEDNGSDGNDSCSVDLGTNGVLTIQQ